MIFSEALSKTFSCYRYNPVKNIHIYPNSYTHEIEDEVKNYLKYRISVYLINTTLPLAFSFSPTSQSASI